MRVINSENKAFLVAKAAKDKRADKVVILDMRKVSDITDYFVICSGDSTRKVKAIADGIDEKLKKEDITPWHIEGYHEALWVLMDYGDAVAHVFSSEMRTFYDLERLWGDAPIKYVA